MNKSMKCKVAALGLALGMGLANTAAVAGTSCSTWAMQQTLSYCASVGGGSACGSVHSGVYRYYYNQCINS